MNNQNLFKSLSNFDEACTGIGLNTSEVLNHFSNNLRTNLEATGFVFVGPDEILYKDGDRITGKEKVLRTEVVAGATCNFISDLCFWTSTEGLELKQDIEEAINAFSKKGYREENVVKEWLKASFLPERIYFVKKTSSTSRQSLEKHYEEIIPAPELNVLAAFNAKYPEFYKKFPNGVQRKNRAEKFCCALFCPWGDSAGVRVNRDDLDWDDAWWFAGSSKF